SATSCPPASSSVTVLLAAPVPAALQTVPDRCPSVVAAPAMVGARPDHMIASGRRTTANRRRRTADLPGDEANRMTPLPCRRVRGGAASGCFGDGRRLSPELVL